ncbi:MAG: N-glycosylase/DNA lyase [Methanomicrobia archaeon]|nr:N-glycosylase/DNA lyase [Methanomicrobia archaeon]
MKELIGAINNLRKNQTVAKLVKERIKEFEENHNKNSESWFSELCFCLLTANSSAKLGIKIQRRVGIEGFLNMPLERLEAILKEEGHVFYKRRSEFIVEARKFDIKDAIALFEDKKEAREWLAKNVKGLGYKEASHLLRNLGYGNVAILDRHILRVMQRYGVIESIPKILTKKKYLELEKKLEELAKVVDMSLGTMDLYLWYMETGKVLK